MTFDYAERDKAQADDRDFFTRYPDQEYRLRRAWGCEHSEGLIPAGYAVFAIIYRRNQCAAERMFGAPITLETNQPDTAIREMLKALSVDPRAMLAPK